MGNKLVLGIEGTPIIVRVAPHTTDAAQLVLKGTNPLAGKALCFALDVPVLSEGKGSAYFLTFVARQAFLAAMDDKLGELIDGKLAFTPPPQPILAVVPPPKVETKDPLKCEDCGCADGLHWKFCSKNN